MNWQDFLSRSQGRQATVLDHEHGMPDGVSATSSTQLQTLACQLQQHRFEPLPVRQVHIPKPEGGVRQLIDLERPLFERIRDSAHELTAWLERTHQVAVCLLDAVQALGLETLLEDSGQKGRHLWCFLDPPIGAREAFALLKHWMALAGSVPEGIHVEPIPADSHRPAEGSPLVTLPLGVHLQSGRRSRLFDRRGQVVHDVETQRMPLLRALVPWDASARQRLLRVEDFEVRDGGVYLRRESFREVLKHYQTLLGCFGEAESVRESLQRRVDQLVHAVLDRTSMPAREP